MNKERESRRTGRDDVLFTAKDMSIN